MGLPRITWAAVLLGTLAVTGGCSFFPGTGPESGAIRAGQSDPEGLPFALVKVMPETELILAQHAPRIAGTFTDRRGPTEIRFGIGDIVGVTIFEAAAGGLFIPIEAGVRPGNFISLPNQQVDNAGNVYVPYAGAIRAQGRTVVEVQQSIVEALKNRALEPQAVVSLIDQRASSISVLGDVNRPERFPANPSGERVLDAIARAGGPRAQGYDDWVMLEREGRRAAVPFGALIYAPENNIYVRPQDTIYLYSEPQTFVVVGGTTAQAQIPFGAWRLSLAEAVGKAGGLNDGLADAASVFLYRGESREVAALMGVDVSRFDGQIIPIIYNLDLRDPAGYFLASKFEMRNKDVLYIANSGAVESGKVMTYLRLVTGTVNDPILAALNYYFLKAAINGTLFTGAVAVTASP